MSTPDQAIHPANSLSAEVLPSLADWQQNSAINSDIPWEAIRSQYLTTDVHFILKYSFQSEELFISIWIPPFALLVEQVWWWQTPIFVYFRKIFISPIFEEQFCHLQYTYFVVIFLSILWLFHFLLVCKIFAEKNVYILLVAFLNLWWVIFLMLL